MKKLLIILMVLGFTCNAFALELVRQKNVATIISFPITDSSGDYLTGADTPDSEIDGWSDSAAGDGWADCTNEISEVGTTGWYNLSVTQAEMNFDYIRIQVKSTNGKTQGILIRTIVGDPLNAATTDDGGTINVTGGAVDTVTTTTTATNLTTNNDKTGYALSAAGNTAVIDEYETQSQADPTGFWVNLKEVDGDAAAEWYDTTDNEFKADVQEVLDEAPIGSADIPGYVQTGMTAQGYTTTRGPYLDAINSYLTGDTYDLLTNDGDLRVNSLWVDADSGDAFKAVSQSAGVGTRFTGAASNYGFIVTGGNDAGGVLLAAGDSGAYGLTATGGTNDISADITGNITGNLSGSIGAMSQGALQDFIDTDTGLTFTDNLATSVLGIASREVWEETITGAKFSTTEAGKRLLNLDSTFVLELGTAQAGAAGSITLAADESAVTDYYEHAICVITAGTGIGQARAINGYNGTTKVATTVPNWATNPDATSEYVILADTEKHIYEVHTGAITAGSFGAGAIDAAALNADAVDEIWDEAQSGHTTAGTFGLYLDSKVSEAGSSGLTLAAIADAVWDEIMSGHTTAGSAGKILQIPGGGIR